MSQILKDKPWVLGVLVLVIAGGGFGIWNLTSSAPYEWRGAAYEPPRPDVGFTLTDTDGEPMATSELEGKVVVMYFGYTYCPDFCPATLTDFQRVKQDLGDDADKVAFVMVSVDPKRDTPERLKEYLDFFDPSFIGLTGSEDDLAPVKDQFGIIAAPGEATPQSNGSDVYWVDHSTKTYVLDQSGDLTLEYAFGTSAEDITADVEHLLDS
jgi:protein SCO1/2